MRILAQVENRIFQINYDEMSFSVVPDSEIDAYSNEGKTLSCKMANRIVTGKSPLDCLVRHLTGWASKAIDLEDERTFSFKQIDRNSAYGQRVINCTVFNGGGDACYSKNNEPFFYNDNIILGQENELPLSYGFLSFISTYLAK